MKPLSASCIEVREGVETHRFVHVTKSAQWFLKGVAGPGTREVALAATNVIEVIRDHIKSIYEAESDEDTSDDEVDQRNCSMRLRRHLRKEAIKQGVMRVNGVSGCRPRPQSQNSRCLAALIVLDLAEPRRSQCTSRPRRAFNGIGAGSPFICVLIAWTGCYLMLLTNTSTTASRAQPLMKLWQVLPQWRI